MSWKIYRAVCILGSLPAVRVALDWTCVLLPPLRICQVENIVGDIQGQQVCHDSLFNKVKSKNIRHLPEDQFGFVVFVWILKNLSGTDRTVLRTVRFDVSNGARHPAPSVVYEQFRIDAEIL